MPDKIASDDLLQAIENLSSLVGGMNTRLDLVQNEIKSNREKFDVLTEAIVDLSEKLSAVEMTGMSNKKKLDAYQIKSHPILARLKLISRVHQINGQKITIGSNY
jgi:hypothetical protein